MKPIEEYKSAGYWTSRFFAEHEDTKKQMTIFELLGWIAASIMFIFIAWLAIYFDPFCIV